MGLELREEKVGLSTNHEAGGCPGVRDSGVCVGCWTWPEQLREMG